MRGAADAPDTDFFALEIFGFFDFGFAHDAVGENVLHRANENKVGVAGEISTDGPLAANDRDGATAAAHRRSYNARRGDVNELKVQIILRIEARFVRKPGQSHSDARRRLEANKFFRRTPPRVCT